MKNRILALIALCIIPMVSAADNEIQSVVTLKVLKGSLDVTRSISKQINLTAANPNVAGFTQSVSTNTVGTALTLGDVATNGVAWFRNLDTTNYVEVGVQDSNTNFLPFIRLNPGEAWSMRLARGLSPYARANATNNVSVVLEKLIFDN